MEAEAERITSRDPVLLDVGDVARELGTDTVHGLSTEAAARRLAELGPNRLEAGPETPAWRKFAAQFADPLIYLLLAAIVVSIAAWAVEGGDGVPI